VGQVRHQQQVLPAGEQVVDRRELAGHPDGRADEIRLGAHIVATHAHLARAGRDEGGQDLDCGGLARAVRAEQREDRALWDRQVDAIQHPPAAERLAEPPGRDRQGLVLLCHAPMFEG
jgi:hypothetical protein